MLDRLEAGDQAEPLALERLGTKESRADQRADRGTGGGYRRCRRLDANDTCEAVGQQLLEKRAVARTDVQGAIAVRKLRYESPQQLRISEAGVTSLLRAVEIGFLVGAGEQLQRRQGVGVEQVTRGARDQPVVHILGQLAR